MSRILRSVLVFLLTFLIFLIPITAVLALHATLIEDESANMADNSLGFTYQRNSFYAAGRAWVFYMGYDAVNASHIYYKSSTNGVTWTARSEFTYITNGYDFSLHWDGTYCHTVWISNTALQNGVSYRRGTPNSDGTITWVATQEVKMASIADGYRYPTITALAGRPYLAYGHEVVGDILWSAESSNVTTGAWSPDLLFQNYDVTFGNVTINACIDAIPSAGVIHLTVENTIPPAMFSEVGSYKYTGGVWTDYETIGVGGFSTGLSSTMPWGDVINVVYNIVPGNNSFHRQSTPGGFWAIANPAVEICDGSYIHASLSLWESATGDMKCFFCDGLANNIAWKHWDQATVTWDVAYIELVTVADCHRMESSMGHESPLGVVYEDTDGADMDRVYYDYLDSFPATPTPLSSTSVNYIVILIIIVFILGGILAILDWTHGGLSSNELATIVICLVVGVIVCMGIWLSS
jgi:hypothetical protein